MKVGDLVRMRGTLDWNGQVGVITKIPRTRYGRWAVRLTSGQLIAIGFINQLEVVNESR